jgi:hypothetical protein
MCLCLLGGYGFGFEERWKELKQVLAIICEQTM